MRSTLLRRLLCALFLVVLAHPAAAGVDRWTAIGPDGGLIQSLAADPAVPGTLYAGTSGGGVWKSLDGGGTWTPTAEGLGAASITNLAVSAGRVYAGAYGIYLLTDGAAKWRRVGPLGFDTRKLAVDPANPDWIWAVGYAPTRWVREVLLSQDGGEHWRVKLHLVDDFYDVAVAPTVPPTVYVAGDEGVFASTDVGATWRQSIPSFDDPPSAPSVATALAVDPRDAEILYAVSYNGFWRTTDAGAHWSRATADAPIGSLLALPGTLLGFGTELRRSEDGGNTWDPVQGLPNWNFTCLAADPAAPGGAWLGGAGFFSEGLLRTSDGGRTWARIGRGLRASDIQAFAFDPFRPRTLYAVTPTARLQRSVDAGASWSPTLTRLDIHSLAADPRHPGILYAGTPGGVFASRDRGAHWQQALYEPQGIEIVVVDRDRPGTIWAAGRRVWSSRDGGGTWKRLASPIDPEGSATASRIFLSPWHPGTLYLIDSYLNLSRSTDGGATWEPIDAESYPVALAFDPTKPDLLYRADYSGVIRKSRDGGTTWEQVASAAGGGSPLTALLIDPLEPAVLYVGTASNGVWRSRDKGVTWQPFSTGIIAPAISCLEADPGNPRRLVACTQGGGLLEIRISSGS